MCEHFGSINGINCVLLSAANFIISSRSKSTKTRTVLVQVKETPERSLRISTVFNFQAMKSVVELNRLLLNVVIQKVPGGFIFQAFRELKIQNFLSSL